MTNQASGDRSARELRAESVVNAPAAKVWAAIVDFDAMPDRSPELVKMLPLKRGGLRVGQNYLGINKRNWVFWPTRSVITELVDGQRVAWLTVSSGATWIWEVADLGDDTSRVTHSRPVEKKITLSSKLFAPAFLGGSAEHSDELEAGMAVSVANLKAEVESA